MFLVRWFLKITGLIPALLIFNPRKYFLGAIRSTARYKGPAVVTMNHTSFKDYMAAMILFPFRRVDVLVSEAMYNFSPVTRVMLEAMGVIKVSARTGNLDSVNEAVKRLHKGHLILVFPEGKIETSPEMFPYQQGAALIAAAAKVPVLPLFHDGNFGLFRKAKCFIGDEMRVEQVVPETKGVKDSASLFTEALFRKTKEFHDYYYRHYYTKQENRHKPSRIGFARLFVKYTAIPLLRFFLKPVIRFENERAALAFHQEKRMVLVCNHSWWVDVPLVHYAFRKRNPLSIAAKDVAELNKSQKIMQKIMGCVFVDRFGYDWASIKTCMNELDREGCIASCPEGALSFGPDILPFHKGSAMLAVTTGSPVVTVYIGCAYKLFHRAYILIGEPLEFEKSGNGSAVEEANAKMEDKMRQLKKEINAWIPESEQELILRQKAFNQERIRRFGGKKENDA